jgi:hypothetical protein
MNEGLDPLDGLDPLAELDAELDALDGLGARDGSTNDQTPQSELAARRGLDVAVHARRRGAPEHPLRGHDADELALGRDGRRAAQAAVAPVRVRAMHSLAIPP